MLHLLRAGCVIALVGLMSGGCVGEHGLKPIVGCARADSDELLAYQLLRRLPHDAGAFTQGLLIVDQWLLESTGLYGQSTVRKLHRDSGREAARTVLPRTLFGEGLALADGRLYQLTWREEVVRIYDPDDLTLLDTSRIEGEGWGLTYDGYHLIQSNGSAELIFRNPADMDEQRRLQVTADGRPLSGLNELQYANGWLLANVFPTDCVAVVDASDGTVNAWLDLSELTEQARLAERTVDVTNGIAYDAEADSYYVTGKRWPFMAEIRIPALAAGSAAGRR